MRSKFVSIAAMAAMLALGSCAHTESIPTINPASVIADAARPEADRANDERRKAIALLGFMQVRPGYQILDMEAGAGYWTEILARATGPSGKVYMQNPAGFATRLKTPLEKRFADGRLPNVTQLFSNFDVLDVPSGSLDLVTWVQGPHELYYKPASGSLGDPDRAFAEIARVLKPNGVLVVIDHSALSGAPPETGNTLHRIDPSVTVALAIHAGLSLDGQGDFLANPEDPKTANVFDPAIRGKTDQHVLRLRKPKAPKS
jgi:predicted methyltransferase